jgi:hypothetical protein
VSEDNSDSREPDPLLASSRGDEAPLLAEARNQKGRWLGLAAGVGVGSAAIAAAMLFWGDKKRAPAKAKPTDRKAQPRSKAVKHMEPKGAGEPAK